MERADHLAWASLPVGDEVLATDRARLFSFLLEDEPALTNGRRHCANPIGRAKLVHDAGQMVLDRLLTDVEELADLAVAHPLGDVAEDLELPWRQGIGWRLVIGRGRPPESPP